MAIVAGRKRRRRFRAELARMAAEEEAAARVAAREAAREEAVSREEAAERARAKAGPLDAGGHDDWPVN